jgi:hypothetical protein
LRSLIVPERQLSVGDKIRLACELHEAGINMMRCNLKRSFPDESAAEIENRLIDWLGTRPGAEFGDGEGEPISWPSH